MIKLDYSIASPEERTKLVAQIIEETPPENLTTRYLEILSDYIIFAMTKEEKKQKLILTDNRRITLRKRETSYEALVDKLENGEDGIYNLSINDKGVILSPKDSISQADIEEIPALKVLVAAIKEFEPKVRASVGTGMNAYNMKKALIQMRQDQYVIRNAYKEPVRATSLIKSIAKLDLDETVFLGGDGDVISTGIINLYTPHHVSALLCNYSALAQETWESLDSDMRWMLEDLNGLISRHLEKEEPLLFDLMIYKIDGFSNEQIQRILDRDYGILYSLEYLSSLWRKKIPRLIAESAQEEFILQSFKAAGADAKWKTCSRCGRQKPSHNRFFSKNKTSKDGFYSICKKCRNKKKED